MIVHKRGKGRSKNNALIKRNGEGVSEIIDPIMKVVNGVIQHKDLISKTITAAKDLYSVGKDVKDLVTSKPKPSNTEKSQEVSDIVNKIRALQAGSGFAFA